METLYEITVSGRKEKGYVVALNLDAARKKAKAKYGIIRHVKVSLKPLPLTCGVCKEKVEKRERCVKCDLLFGSCCASIATPQPQCIDCALGDR